jgi:SAM-dependent methyltransferase
VPRFGPGGRARRALGFALRPLPEGSKARLRGLAARSDNRRFERSLARAIERKERGAKHHDDPPVPPPLLRVRVTGLLAEREPWLETSATDARLIRELLERNGRPIEGMRAILDFGCGCGRVARHWAGLDGPEVHGADVSAAGVRWCNRNLTHMTAVRSDPLPPLPYPDGRFDFVYALSVLTHLPEDAGRAWLSELLRVVEPGGLLLFTVHGERFREQLGPAEAERFDAGELITKREPAELSGSNAYAVFHPPAYVRERLLPDAGAELVEAVYEGPPEGGLTPMPVQDNYLVRRAG